MQLLTDKSLKVDRIEAEFFTPGFFLKEYQSKGIPVVISGLLHVADWHLEYLCQELGETEFPIRHYGRQRYEQDKRNWTSMGSGVESKSMTFAQYAQLLESGAAEQQDLYLGKCPIDQTSLVQTSGLPDVGRQLGLSKPVTAHNLWVGMAGHTTCLHYDPFDGALMQMHGSKHLILFPPSQLCNLYPFPLSAHLQHGLNIRATYSQLYPNKPDFEAFPNFAQALQHRYEVILNQGDLLYIPASWWHEVTAIGDGMVCSVNRFWSIQPTSRALCSWSKWRAHLGSILAVPRIVQTVLTEIGTEKTPKEFGKLWRKL
jgi:hypothetical protein